MRIQKAIYSISFAALLGCGLSPAFGLSLVPPPTHQVVLKRAELVEGRRYPAGTELTVYDDSGKVAYVRLGGNVHMNGHMILRGTRIYLSDGEPVSYSSVPGQKINGILLPKDAQFGFNKEGRLHTIHLPAGTKIRSGGKTYAGNQWIYFDAHGKVIPEEQAEGLY